MPDHAADTACSLPQATPQEAAEAELCALWAEYLDTHSDTSRNRLLERYLPLVRSIAQRVSRRLPREVDVDDLFSFGVFGLMDALATFDPARKTRFSTYAVPRIRGAIIDELRAWDWVPRLTRARSQKLLEAAARIQVQFGRSGTAEELALALQVSEAEIPRMIRDAVATGGMVSLSRQLTDGPGNDSRQFREIDVLADPRTDDPQRHSQRQDLKELITRGLKRSERLLILLYYFEGLSMREVGAALDLTESRVCQLHAGILNRLRQRLKGRGDELDGVLAA